MRLRTLCLSVTTIVVALALAGCLPIGVRGSTQWTGSARPAAPPAAGGGAADAPVPVERIAGSRRA